MSTTPSPSGNPSPDPLGGPGGPQAGPAQPHRPFMAGLFDSLRRSGVVRTEQRVVGGVCGGLAQRLGIDLILVRCVVAVLCLVMGLGLLAYGLAWALLPEERDGRIHLQQAFSSDMSAGFLGAVVCVIAGAARPDWGLGEGVVVGAGWAGVTWGLLWTVGVIGLLIWLIGSQRQQRTERSTQSARPVADGAWSAPAGQPRPGWDADQGAPANGAASGPAWSAPAPGPSYGPQGVGPAYARPRPPHRPGPGRRLSAIVGGLLLLALAGMALAERHHMLDRLSYSHALVVVGTVTALLGAGVLISGLIGRRGGWLSALGVPAALIALPMLAAGPLAPHGLDLLVADDVVIIPSDERLSNGDVDLGSFGAGDAVIDLRNLGQAHSGTTARVSLGSGDLRILVDRDQPVRIRARVGAGEVSALADREWGIEGVQDRRGVDSTWRGSDNDGPGEAASIDGVRIDAVLAPEGTPSDALTIDTSVGAGDITIEESPHAWTPSPATPSPSTTPSASSPAPSPAAGPTAPASSRPSGSTAPSPTAPTPTH
ncbi:Phage shock protein PspC (stress-responsive transcriptional regulator) [Actinomyces denticolens]|uniref:Phage shock protein PspC (Stress-responsive transcriptional regulator) n=1 Tax=Actinomyces denticolens TaxID=52767 RepID=A0ABY1I3L4_9ACTO|nr:PspC domain-containing protein [Actinomyces denticolens]SHI43489.1 Phage shock protein PspC (stress-responsive transcriptional regulator) [Actinomyces denticolens]